MKTRKCNHCGKMLSLNMFCKDGFKCRICIQCFCCGREDQIRKKLAILVDMDGTLVNFIGKACEVFGLSEEKVISEWTPGVFNICDILKIEEKVLWKTIEECGESFWEDMKPYDWADDLFDFCQQMAPTFILTKPTFDPRSLSGKIKWLHKWKGKEFQNYILSPYKELCSRQGSLLIDDHEVNVDNFSSLAGDAILFPMISNRRNSIAGNIDLVKQEIDSWYQRMLKIM